MNRYTQLSTTQFNPLSIEELSIVPMAMRQRHDQANAQLEERRAQLNAFGEALPHHEERAQALIQQMNSAIDNESEQLNNNGYTRTTGSNIIKLNRDYQNLMSPNGELGKIASAKKAYSENYKQYVEDAQKKGWGLDRIQNGWSNHAKNYFGYDEEGNITTISQAGAPEKYQISDFLKEHASYLGHIKDRVDKMGGGNVHINQYGMLEVRNTSGAVHELNNSPQLQHLNNLMMSTFLTPGSKGYESAMYEGKDLNQLKGEIDSAIGMMFKQERTDTRSQSLSLTKLPGSDGDGSGLPGVINIATSTGVIGAEHMGSHRSATSRIEALANNRDMTLSEEAELAKLRSADKEYIQTLRNDETHTALREKYDERVRKLTDVQGSDDIRQTDRPPLWQTGNYDNWHMGRGPYWDAENLPLFGDDEELREITKQMREIENNAWDQSLINSNRYTISDTTPQNERKLKALSKNFARSFASGNAGMFTTPGVDVVTLNINGNMRTGRHVDRIDKERLGKLVFQAASRDENNISFRSVEPVGNSDMVEYEVSVKVPEGVTAAFDRVRRLGEKGQGDVKKDDVVTFKMIARNTKDNANINNLYGQTIQTFASIDAEGLAVAQGMNHMNNKYTLLNALSNTPDATYNNVKNNPSSFFNSKQDALSAAAILTEKALEYQINTGYFERLKRLGEDDLNINDPAVIDKAVKDFYEQHGDEQITNY